MKTKDENLEFKGLCAALFYISTSVSMVFINKSVLSVHKFDCPFFIMVLQMIFSLCVLKMLLICSVIKIPESSKDVKLWPITVFYSIHSITALTAIGHMTVPMYTAVKRCGPLVIIAFSVIMLRKTSPPYKVLLSVLLITVGAVIAGFGDIRFSWSGYMFCCVSVIAQSIYLIFTQKAAEQGVTALQILYETSFFSIPFFLIGTTFLEYDKILKLNQRMDDISLLFVLSIQVSLGIVLNYALYLCTTLNSALTTSLAGVLKSVLQTVAGFFVFGGVPILAINMIGIVLNLVGGVLYIGAKYQASQKPKPVQQEKSITDV